MANILHIETSSKNCSVSISKNNEILCLCEESSESFIHNEKLHLFIQYALEGSKLDIKDINAVSISKGPGSYTGLRIGASAAKGICFALDIPLISISTLEILIQPYKNKNFDYFIPVIDARRLEFYNCMFDSNLNIISEVQPHILNEKSFHDFQDNSILFVGDSADKIQKYFKENKLDFNNSSFINELASAKNMIQISYDKYINNDFENLAYFEPFYLKNGI